MLVNLEPEITKEDIHEVLDEMRRIAFFHQLRGNSIKIMYDPGKRVPGLHITLAEKYNLVNMLECIFS